MKKQIQKTPKPKKERKPQMVTISVTELIGWKAKMIGMVGKTVAQPIFLQTRFGIHTFYMQFPIDVLILDQAGVIVKLRKVMEPNKIMVWHPKYYKVLEVAHGYIDYHQLRVGDRMRVVVEEQVTKLKTYFVI